MNRWLSARLHARSVRHGPLVLVYHSVMPGAARPDWPWSLSSSDFRDHLAFLADAGYTTVTLGDLMRTPDMQQDARHVVITFDDGYRDNLAAAEMLRARDMTASWFVLSGNLGLAPRWADHAGPRDAMMDGAELRQLHAAGFEIGSHGVDHLRFTALDEAALKHQLVDSRQALEHTLGQPVSGLAYPFGAWDARVKAAAAAAGYRQACTTDSGWALRDRDPLRVRRLTITHRDNVAVLARKLAWARNDVAWSRIAGTLVRRPWRS